MIASGYALTVQMNLSTQPGNRLTLQNEGFKVNLPTASPVKRKNVAYKTRPKVQTNCAECKKETTIRFIPFQGRPVLYNSCFLKKKGQANQG